MTVVDASAVVTALIGAGTAADHAMNLLTEKPVKAPAHIDVEALSSLRRLHLAGRLDAAQASRAAHHLRELPIDRVPTTRLTDRIWELRHNITPYDAAYVALAEAHGCALVTADARLARSAGPRCRFEVIVDR